MYIDFSTSMEVCVISCIYKLNWRRYKEQSERSAYHVLFFKSIVKRSQNCKHELNALPMLSIICAWREPQKTHLTATLSKIDRFLKWTSRPECVCNVRQVLWQALISADPWPCGAKADTRECRANNRVWQCVCVWLCA